VNLLDSNSATKHFLLLRTSYCRTPVYGAYITSVSFTSVPFNVYVSYGAKFV